MFRTIQWTSGTRLSCVNCTAAKVILCVDPDLLAERTCPASDLLSIDTADGDFVWNTMPAELVDSVQVKNNCGGAYFWRYTFNYDDAYIKVGSNLSTSDILNVVCQGCLTQYAEDLAGNEIVVETIAAAGEVPEHLQLTSQHGCKYDFFAGSSEPTQCILTSVSGDGDPVVITAVSDHVLLAGPVPVDLINPSNVFPADVYFDFMVEISAATLSPGFQGDFKTTMNVDGVDTLQETMRYTNTGTIAFEGTLYVPHTFFIQLAPGETQSITFSIDATTIAAGSGVDTVSASGRIIFIGTTCVS